jgi:hypothetical protein
MRTQQRRQLRGLIRRDAPLQDGPQFLLQPIEENQVSFPAFKTP